MNAPTPKVRPKPAICSSLKPNMAEASGVGALRRDAVAVGVPAGVRQPRHDGTRPISSVAMPMAVSTMISSAHSAIGSGLASTTRQLASTAASTPTGRSSSSGIATTLLANTGAASTPPSSTQPSNSQPVSASTTWRTKSAGLLTTCGANQVTSEAEVSTQPVPASASRAPKRISRRAVAPRGHQARTATPIIAPALEVRRARVRG